MAGPASNAARTFRLCGDFPLIRLAGAGEELTLEQCEHISDCLCKINDHAEISDDLLAETELMEATLIERVRELRNETLS